MGKKEKEINFKIEKIYGYLNEKKNRVVAKVKWYDNAATLDIRKCWTTEDGTLMLGGGISLQFSELGKLQEVLEEADDGEDDQKGVDFARIFASSGSILDRRSAGYTTKDGFIILEPKPGFSFKRATERSGERGE